MTLLVAITIALYLTATVLFCVQLVMGNQRLLRIARWAQGAGVAAHLALIGYLCLHHANPLQDLSGALNLTAWILSAACLAGTFLKRLGSVAALISPLGL